MKKRIRVTAKDIAEGIPGVGERCPVARALKRAGFEQAKVGKSFFKTLKQGFQFCYNTPLAVSKFLFRFDRGASVVPFSFTIEVIRPPQNYQRPDGPLRFVEVDR